MRTSSLRYRLRGTFVSGSVRNLLNTPEARTAIGDGMSRTHTQTDNTAPSPSTIGQATSHPILLLRLAHVKTHAFRTQTWYHPLYRTDVIGSHTVRNRLIHPALTSTKSEDRRLCYCLHSWLSCFKYTVLAQRT